MASYYRTVFPADAGNPSEQQLTQIEQIAETTVDHDPNASVEAFVDGLKYLFYSPPPTNVLNPSASSPSSSSSSFSHKKKGNSGGVSLGKIYPSSPPFIPSSSSTPPRSEPPVKYSGPADQILVWKSDASDDEHKQQLHKLQSHVRNLFQNYDARLIDTILNNHEKFVNPKSFDLSYVEASVANTLTAFPGISEFSVRETIKRHIKSTSQRARKQFREMFCTNPPGVKLRGRAANKRLSQQEKQEEQEQQVQAELPQQDQNQEQKQEAVPEPQAMILEAIPEDGMAPVTDDTATMAAPSSSVVPSSPSASGQPHSPSMMELASFDDQWSPAAKRPRTED